MRATIPAFTRNDLNTLGAGMLPVALASGYLLFPEGYFSNAGLWLGATALLLATHSAYFMVQHRVAWLLRRRLPQDRHTARRLTLSTLLCILITATYINLLLRLLDAGRLLGYRYHVQQFWRLFAIMGTLTLVWLFVRESLLFLARYKANAIETQRLKNEYTRSRLLGLQSQVNPHFLFNNLNTLSSLITEDPERAERYLDELSKVYRYLLRNNEVQLVSLGTELQFLEAYFHLLQARHGQGIRLEINLPHCPEGQVPPLTLQMIVENIMNRNSFSKDAPLVITIGVDADCWLQVRNNIQARVGSTADGPDEILDHIIQKIHLLCREEVTIFTEHSQRVISIPLITAKEEVFV